MKCFQKVEHAYFISLSLTYNRPQGAEAKCTCPPELWRRSRQIAVRTVIEQGLYVIATCAPEVRRGVVKQSPFMRLPRRPRPSAVTPRSDICFVRLMPCSSLQGGLFQAGSLISADFMDFLRKDYSRAYYRNNSMRFGERDSLRFDSLQRQKARREKEKTPL